MLARLYLLFLVVLMTVEYPFHFTLSHCNYVLFSSRDHYVVWLATKNGLAGGDAQRPWGSTSRARQASRSGGRVFFISGELADFTALNRLG